MLARNIGIVRFSELHKQLKAFGRLDDSFFMKHLSNLIGSFTLLNHDKVRCVSFSNTKHILAECNYHKR